MSLCSAPSFTTNISSWTVCEMDTMKAERVHPPNPARWARQISKLDAQLGFMVDSVRSLLKTQAIVLTRQDYARQALEAFPDTGPIIEMDLAASIRR